MATKTTKKKGETATTVSVGIRIDPKIKFALDMMGRQQKRSLTAVIEWAISNAIAQQASSFDETFAELINRVWSTDESTRFANMALYMPESLSYDELRIWETIKISSEFWHQYPDGTWDYEPSHLIYDLLRAYWSDLLAQVEKHKGKATVTRFDKRDIDIPF